MSVDPFDDTAVWMVQPYAVRPNLNVARGGYRLAVGKAFGGLHPDLAIPHLQLGANVVRQGGRLGLEVVVRNQGDRPTTGATLRITLSLDQFPSSADVVAAQANVPAIEAGQEITIGVSIGVDASPGRYYVIAVARDVEPGLEYSTTNNFWPARESTRLQVFR